MTSGNPAAGIPVSLYAFVTLPNNRLRAVGGGMMVVLAWCTHAKAQDLGLGVPPPPAPSAPAPKLTKAPALRRAAEPTYPAEALAEKLSADVKMMVDLDAGGRVTAVEIVQPVGHGFDDAAKVAMLRYEFSPGEIDGRPAPIRIEYTLHFVPRSVSPADAGVDDAAPPAVAPPPPPPPPTVVVVEGRVREKGTRNPLPGMEIAVIAKAPDGAEKPATSGATTDQEGHFRIEGERGVALRLVVTDGKHQACVRDVDATATSGETPAQIDCLVARQLGTSYETTVKAPPTTQAVTRYTLSQPELTSVPGTFGDPLRVIQNLPGVARTPYGLGLLVIRGASPSDSGVFIEGHSVPLLYHFGGGPSVLAPQLIDHIDFYPGNFGVKYGRATAGIIDVGIKTDATPLVHGQVDLNLLDSSAYVEGPLGHGWTGSVSARRSYLDVLIDLASPSGTTTVAPVFWDYQAGVHRDVGNGKLALFAFGSNDSLRVISKDPVTGNLDLDTERGFHKLIGVWTATAHGWANRLSPAYGYERQRLTAGGIDIDESANVFSLRDELSRNLGPHLTWRLGFDGELRRDSLFFNVPLAPDARLYGDTISMFQQRTIPLHTTGMAFFTDAVWEPGGGVTIIPGLRGDYARAAGQDRFTLDPRLVARWKLTPAQTLKAGVGLFHQMQAPQLLDPEYGNPRLPPIEAEQYSLGFVRQLTPKLSVDTTLYYVRRHNEAVAVPTTEAFAATGQGRSYGMELILKHEFTERFYGWIAYTLSRSEQTVYTVNDATQGNAGLGSLQTGTTQTHWYPTDYDQTHNLIMVGSYAWRAWRFGSRFRLVTGAPDTPLTEGAFDADSGQYACQAGPTNSIRKPTFTQLDVRVERLWTFSAWQFGAYVDVQNVTNAQNPEATLHDYRCRGSTPVRGLPLLPIIGLRGLF
ncbi:MAG TPA: TonB family protein [Polyangia bacterium]